MIPYILNVGLILSGCLAFYKLLLQKETFYRLNRYMLMLCMAVAFSLPLLHVPQQLSFRKREALVIAVKNIPLINAEKNNSGTAGSPAISPLVKQKQVSANTARTFSWQQVLQWCLWLYWFGVIVFGLNFLVQIVILLYRAYTSPFIQDGKFRIVEVSGDKAPCSFANNIFINPEKYEWETYNQILTHEKIHIQQGHSFDILFAELVLIVQWFNPFAWLYRKEVESNLEFLTDDELVQKERIEKSSYQLSLLKVSAPHFPLSLTTNYNQSLLKKRIAMMNTKRSNVHTAWKYFFLLPLLVAFASLLNEPIAKAQNKTNIEASKNEEHHHDIKLEGYWFATIKGDKIRLQFTEDESDHNSYNGSDFLLSEFPNLPRGTSGDFKLTRDAGTMNFTGKFDGDQGMGRYKFVPDAAFGSYISAQGIGKLDNEDLMTFFFVNITKEYVAMLKSEGFTDIEKDALVGVAALKVDKAFINSIRENGYKDVELEQFTALKALGVDGAYIKEIKNAGYKDISLEQLISFKAQGIDKEFLAKIPKTKGKDGNLDADNVVSLKALNVDETYSNGFKELGYDDIAPEQLVSMKAVGVTPEFVKQFRAMGYKDIPADELVPLKAQDITAEFIKEFEAIGYKNIPVNDLVSLKALGVKPAYIQSFKEKGYNVSLDNAVALKSQNITPDYIKEFEALGFKNISLDDATALKSMSVTPQWIKEMKAKGFDYNDVSKYITLKSLQ